MNTSTSSLILGVSLLIQAASASGLEKLFTNKSQRAHLDAIRYGLETETPTESKQIASKITVNGLILSPGGHNQVWINGSNSQLEHAANGFSTNKHRVRYNKVPLRISDTFAQIKLRPGETLFTVDSSKKDSYQWEPDPIPAVSPSTKQLKSNTTANSNSPLTNTP